MKKLVGGNFKMNIHSLAEVDSYVSGLSSVDASLVDVVIAPQLPLITYFADKLEQVGVMMGSQDVWYEEKGAFTGQTSPLCLQSLGVKYVIVGHGERRNFAKEDDDKINKKTASVISHGMRPIVCIGESLEQKEQGQTQELLRQQIELGLKGVDKSQLDIAYEPLWAIGTGKIPTNDDIKEIHSYIRSLVGGQSRILYGGSVSDANAHELIKIENVDGFLVGGASLDPVKFSKIIQACC